MGCDGGTIPRRDELVRVKKKPEQKDKESELSFRWKHCSIRQLPLQPPIVACSLGRLYSKESILEGLLDRSTLPESATHIKTLKDVKNLNLTPNPAYNGDEAKNGGYLEGGRSPYICPVIGLEMSGKYKFCFVWTCGCVVSERSLREVKTFNCHKCQLPFKETDIVIMNAEGDDLERMKENANFRKAERKSNKKRKNEEVTSTKIETEESEELSKRKKKEKEERAGPSTSGIKREVKDPAYKKAKDDYSISQDPQASEVLKSIFTTHKSAAEQTKAHWITYNPFYN